MGTTDEWLEVWELEAWLTCLIYCKICITSATMQLLMLPKTKHAVLFDRGYALRFLTYPYL